MTPPRPPVHDDLVARVFTAPSLNTLWLIDITEHPAREGKLYLCALKEACSMRIVGYWMSDRMSAELAARPRGRLRSPEVHHI